MALPPNKPESGPDNPDHTPAFKIFHYYFHVMIPAAFSRSATQKFMGTPQYSSKESEMAAARELVHRQHTVAEMVDLFESGVNIVLVNPYDSVRIYTWLRDHIATRAAPVLGTRVSLHPGRVPINDLKKMDQFAEHIFRVARNFGAEKADHRKGRLQRRLEEVNRSRISAPPKINKQTGTVEVKEHVSLLNDIKSDAIRRTLPTPSFGSRRKLNDTDSGGE